MTGWMLSLVRMLHTHSHNLYDDNNMTTLMGIMNHFSNVALYTRGKVGQQNPWVYIKYSYTVKPVYNDHL